MNLQLKISSIVFYNQFMLFKIVLEKQIRVFDCKEKPSIALIHAFILKTFPRLKAYAIHYLDEDNDQIVLETDLDLNILLTADNKKPKIFISTLESEAFDATVKLQPDYKIEEKGEILESQKSQQRNSIDESKQASKKVEEPEKKEQQLAEQSNLQVHPAKCDNCGVEQIQGIRFKCSVCSDFDLCQKCEALQGHLHPLIKIRFNDLAPISCKVEFSQSQKIEEVAERLKNSSVEKKQKLIFQSKVEREQIIISYLGNLLGEDEFKKYKDFSKICKAETYEDLIEEYLAWLERESSEAGGNGFQKMINWIKNHLAKLRESFK